MYEKYIFLKNGLRYCLLLMSMSICNSISDLCPLEFNGGYIETSCSRRPGDWCKYCCNPGIDENGGFLICVKGGIWFPDTNSICKKSVLCPAVFNGGYLEPPCSRLPGDSCTFYCNPEFVKNGTSLTCGEDGKWNLDPNTICIKSALCPPEFNGGYIEPSCSRRPGDLCNYYCNPGFFGNGGLLACGKGGNWSPDTSTACIKPVLCPAVFNGGYLESSCSRLPGNSCTFYCNPEFVKNGSWLTCGGNGKWIQDPNTICIKSAFCPSEFNDGYIETSCSRRPGDWCNYYCYPGFVWNGGWLACGKGGNWIPDTSTACKKSGLCPSLSNSGYLEPTCTRLPGESCTFVCNPEFVKNGTSITCGKDGKWIQDPNTICIKSVKQTSSDGESRHTSVGVIVGVTTAAPIVIVIIVAIVAWISKRVRKSQRRVPGHTGSTCLRQRENPDQNVRTLRQPLNSDGIDSVSSFESPSNNADCVYLFEQRIPTISSSCKYPEPPPSYSETQIVTSESPPTYNEVVTDPTRFNLYI